MYRTFWDAMQNGGQVTAFDELMNEHQVVWRQRNVASEEQGTQNGLQREWILPAPMWQEGLWPPLRGTEPGSVQHYLDDKKVQRHTGSHNLKSSWISGVNTYFPFGQTDQGRMMLASFLAANVDDRIVSVDSVELEYAEDGSLSPLELLGEGGGSRGSGQTSPDIAFIVNDGRGLLLVENKLTEHSFYRCSARTSSGSPERPANPDVTRCSSATTVASDPAGQCHQEAWGRRYWSLLRDAVNTNRLADLSCCPASKAGYQLFRQQALAEGIANKGHYDFVASCVALDARNAVLATCLSSTGIKDVRQWGDLFQGRASFRVFTHQDWVEWVRGNDHDGHWIDWSEWLHERYAL